MDQEVFAYFEKEAARQNQGIELIASENYPSIDVMACCSSIFMAKYAEGYPGKRYYGGCENVDAVERLAIERAKQLFGCNFANVQPHSGSQANYAAYRALLSPGDKVLSLTLNDGGHLTHGSPVSFSSHDYTFVNYPLNEEGRLDYELIAKRMEKERPNLLLAGYSAYPFAIDFKKMRRIVDAYNAQHDAKCRFMVDMAHICGIVAAKLTQNPCDYADIVTSTTHKTLRGPRGGLILCNDPELAKKVDFAIFPYSQGGPLEHIIAGKAVCFGQALKPNFVSYMKQVLENTKACNDRLAELGAKVSGTENHLFLCDVLSSFGITGKEAEAKLSSIGIVVNKNMIHGDTLKPAYASGIRVGFAAVTSRGCTKENAVAIADLIYDCLKNPSFDELSGKERVSSLVSRWKDVTLLQY